MVNRVFPLLRIILLGVIMMKSKLNELLILADTLIYEHTRN